MDNFTQYTTWLNLEHMSDSCTISLKNITADSSDHSTFAYVISGPLLTALIMAGTTGNALSIKAFYTGDRRRMATINLFLIILAAWDLTLVVSSFFLYNFSVLVNSHVVVYGEYVRTYPALFVITHAAHTASIWCVVALAAERYFALCHPLKHRTKNNFSRCRLILAIISCASLCASMPKFFEVLVEECYDSDTGSNVPWVDSSPLRKDPVYSLVYIVIGGLLLHSLAPFLIMLILSVRVMIEVKQGATLRRRISARRTASVKSATSNIDRSESIKSNRSDLTRSGSMKLKASIRASFERSSRRQHMTEKNEHTLAVTVVAKFLICHFLPTILDICERLMTNEDFEGPIVDMLVDVSNLLVVLNSSINFVLYSACSARFRKQLLIALQCKNQKHIDHDRRSLTSSMIRHASVRSSEDGLLQSKV